MGAFEMFLEVWILGSIFWRLEVSRLEVLDDAEDEILRDCNGVAVAGRLVAVFVKAFVVGLTS